MKRWLAVVVLGAGCRCGGSDKAPIQSKVDLEDVPGVDCTAYDTAMRELKPWESAGNLVSAVDVGFAVKKMAELEPVVEVSSALSPGDFSEPTLTITLKPKGAEEMIRSLPTDDSEVSKRARESCEDGVYMRIQGESEFSILWEGRPLTGKAPVTVSAWGPLPTEMSFGARVYDWTVAGAAPQAWQEMICVGIGKRIPCRFGPAMVSVDGPLSEPRVRVVTHFDEDRVAMPLSYTWVAPKE